MQGNNKHQIQKWRFPFRDKEDVMWKGRSGDFTYFGHVLFLNLGNRRMGFYYLFFTYLH